MILSSGNRIDYKIQKIIIGEIECVAIVLVNPCRLCDDSLRYHVHHQSR
ncbi:hypothetical protein DSUL_40130 [Desulfovibrionales bacterium]